MIWKYSDNTNSQQIINNVLEQNSHIISQTPAPQYKVYCLPILRPEQDERTIVSLACYETTFNILEIQKSNRKKITFS